MIFLDLFAGIGGFALAAKHAGLRFSAHYFSEIDQDAIAIYQKNYPDAVALGDITTLDANKLRQDHPGENFLICGGFPCQDLSDAGPRTGLQGARSGLWWEMYRVIGEVRPKYALVENVPALRNNGLDRVLFALAEIGYDAEWEVIPARAVGAPHRRERIWVVAYPHLHRLELSDAGKPAEKGGLHMGEGAKPDCPDQGDGAWADWEAIAASRTVHSEPILLRVADGLPTRLHQARIKALGNAIVPQVAAYILRRLPLNS